MIDWSTNTLTTTTGSGSGGEEEGGHGVSWPWVLVTWGWETLNYQLSQYRVTPDYKKAKQLVVITI